MVKHIRERIDVENCVIVSPDAGGAKRQAFQSFDSELS
jgi:phosphoribosylpyrophosphate synthetase